MNECLASCKAVVCFGEAKQRFADAFYAAENKKGCQILEADSLEAALDAALDASSDGDVILLSPACSSFDEFKSFEQRGEVFKQMVATRIAQA